MKTSRRLRPMPSRRCRTNACCRPFAAREPLTSPPPSGAGDGASRQKLTSGQWLQTKSTGLFREIAVDALVFEFIGLAIVALCVIVLAVPSSQRPRGRRISH
jgi:hypothetical protein